MVFQYFNVADQLVLPLLCLLPLQLQLLQLLQLAGQFLPLSQRLRNQTVGTVGTAAVFQILQSLSQCIGGTGFITGGNKGIEPSPKRLVLGNGKVCQLQETCPNEYRLFYTQKHLSAVISGQFRNLQTGGSFICAEDAENAAAFAGSFDGDVFSVPAQLDAAGHRTAGPGSVALLVRKGSLGGVNTGLDAVEHRHKESAPGALAPLVGGFDDVQTRLQCQCFMLQLAKGGGHGIDLHGSVTS